MQRPPISPALLLLSLLILLSLSSQLPTASGSKSMAGPRGSAAAATRWCRAHGWGGLARLGGTGEGADAVELAARAARTRHRPGCYWISPASKDDVRWLVDNPYRDTGCICLMIGSGVGASRLRLHMTGCSRRLPFLCQQEVPKPPPPAPLSEKSSTAAASAAASATSAAPGGGEFMDDEASPEEANPDEAVDHAKFPMAELPSSSSNSWLPVPPQPPRPVTSKNDATLSPTPQAASAKTTGAAAAFAGSDAGRNSTHHKDHKIDEDSLLSESQRSEFVTLVVLYSIVGVVCAVLLALCVARCCRGRCGKSRIRYVKHVDTDDIPRFMPSSWA